MTNVKLHKNVSSPISGTNTPRVRLDAKARQKIGLQLRAMYTGLQEAPLPDPLADLLDELRTSAGNNE
jgi:hypothetical protein